MLEVGSLGPDFVLYNQEGTPIKLSRLLDDVDGLVLYFFVQAGSPGCVKEATTFQELLPELEKRRVRVAGVSQDSVSSLAEFARGNGITFDLLADTEHRSIEEWGAWRGMGTARMTYILDSGGVVRHVFPRVNVNAHAQEVLALFSAPSSDAAAAGAAAAEGSATGAVSAASMPELVHDVARSSLRLLLAQAQAGTAIPDDISGLAAEVAARRR